ncbi:hypothetical protein ACWEOZ_25895 [Actinoplanes sp. NPDC004185]
MTGQHWQPVVAIGSHGSVLGLDADGSWVVADGGKVRGVAVGANLTMLLPLLEQPHRQLAAAVAAVVPSAPPWDELLVFALGWPTEYWPALALGWLEDGYPSAGVRDALTALRDDAHRSQPLRHRALRLCRHAIG